MSRHQIRIAASVAVIAVLGSDLTVAAEEQDRTDIALPDVQMGTADMKRVETHLKRTFNTGGIILKPRGKPNDSCEVYVGDEFIGVVFEDEDEAGSFMFEMAILAEDLPQD